MNNNKAVLVLILSCLLSYLSAAKSEEQLNNRFIVDRTNGKRVNYQDELVIYNQYQHYNSSGNYLRELLTNHSRQEATSLEARLEIIDATSGDVIVNMLSPFFDLAFVDPKTRYIVLLNRTQHSKLYIWVLTSFGKVIHKELVDGFYDGMVGNEALLSGEMSSKLTLKSGLDGNPGMESEIESGTNLDSTDESKDKKIIVYISCGPRPWIDRVAQLNYDHSGNPIGIDYWHGGRLKSYQFDSKINLYRQKLSQNLAEIDHKFPLSCDTAKRSRFVDYHYVRWCQSEDEVNRVETWALKDPNFDPELLSPSFNLQQTDSLIRVGYQQKINRMKYVFSLDQESGFLTTCPFVGEIINGTCVEKNSEEFFQFDILNGVSHGLERSFYDGELESSCEYYHGFKSGDCKDFDSGELITDCSYYGDTELGFCSEYHSSGVLDFECEMLNELEHGQCTYYNNDGGVKEITFSRYGEVIWKSDMQK